MDNDAQAILEAYIFETGEQLDRLDALLLQSEKAGGFRADDVNEIFRLMHTIKGSSAMMDFQTITELAHRAEDLFNTVRQHGLPGAELPALFELAYAAADELRALVERAGRGDSPETDESGLENKISALLRRIPGPTADGANGSVPNGETRGAGASAPTAAPTGAASDVATDVATSVRSPAAGSPAASGLPTDGAAAASEPPAQDARFPARVRVRFAPDEPMPGARAFLLVRLLHEQLGEFATVPERTDTPEGSAAVAQNGLLLCLSGEPAEKKALAAARDDPAVASAGPEPPAGTGGAAGISAAVSPSAAAAPSGHAESPAAQAAAAVIPAGAGAVVRRQNSAAEPAQTGTAPAVPGTRVSSSGSAAQSLISVRLSRLDGLMDLTGELVIAQSMLAPYIQGDGAQKALYHLHRLTDELQEQVMSMRMMPISGVFRRMQRVVRDMVHHLGRSVTLKLEGEETEVDKSVLDVIGDPILHTVRNAVDHGIEPPEERTCAGKPPEGTVTLSARNTGGDVVVSIRDDGRGIDRETVLSRARERGLLKKPEQAYTDRDVFALLMLPGFSTNRQVTEYSGRGVGMDVVKSSVEALGGRVSLSSAPGKGTTVRFTIPLTVAAINGIRMKAGDLDLLLPLLNVIHLFRTPKRRVVRDDQGRELILFQNQYFPFVRLRTLYCPGAPETAPEDGIVLLVETGGRAYCVLADSVPGEQQVVVKPLPALFKRYGTGELGISGCAVLDSDHIGLILDPAAVAAHLGL